MSDLVEHLRGLVNPRYVAELVSSDLITEAADRIASLETEVAGLKLYASDKSNQYVAAMEENKALRKALEPFAKECEGWNEKWPDDTIVASHPLGAGCDFCGKNPCCDPSAFTVGDLRRARLASERGAEE